MKFDMPACGACRTCEIACAFHHTGEFRPAISSIEILDKEDEKGHLVSILEAKRGQRMACDGCQALEEPACASQCKEKEELIQFIKELLQSAEKHSCNS